MPQTRLINHVFSQNGNVEITGSLAFLIENVSETETLHFGFSEGMENIKLEPKENRPFRASDGNTFEGELWVKTTANYLIIKEVQVLTESV
jgi:hypothetical protein